MVRKLELGVMIKVTSTSAFGERPGRTERGLFGDVRLAKRLGPGLRLGMDARYLTILVVRLDGCAYGGMEGCMVSTIWS